MPTMIFTCPRCGALLPAGVRGCPDCLRSGQEPGAGTRPLRGVRGWLMLLCVSLTAGAPLAATVQIVRWSSPLNIVLQVAFAAFSAYVGVSLWRARPNALRLVRVYLVTVLSAALAVAVGSTVVAALAGGRDALGEVLGALFDAVISLIGFYVWWSYFKKSRRVKATFGANLGAPAVGAPQNRGEEQPAPSLQESPPGAGETPRCRTAAGDRSSPAASPPAVRPTALTPSAWHARRGLLALFGAAALSVLGVLVWATRFHYSTLRFPSGGVAFEMREDRYTGKTERLTPDGWIPVQAPRTPRTFALDPLVTTLDVTGSCGLLGTAVTCTIGNSTDYTIRRIKATFSYDDGSCWAWLISDAGVAPHSSGEMSADPPCIVVGPGLGSDYKFSWTINSVQVSK